jgi:hypothetical protein
MQSPSTVCVPSNSFPLAASIPGVWTGSQVANNQFVPTEGELLTTVQFTGTHLGCMYNRTFQINQYEKPEIEPFLPITTCTNMPPVFLNGNPNGGNWSGSGITGSNEFYTQLPGVYTLTYSVSNAHCTSDALLTIQVLDSAVCTLSSSGNLANRNFQVWQSGEIINFQFDKMDGECKIRLFSPIGKELPGGQISIFQGKGQFTIPGRIPPGIYNIKAFLAGKVLSEKLRIE